MKMWQNNKLKISLCMGILVEILFLEAGSVCRISFSSMLTHTKSCIKLYM